MFIDHLTPFYDNNENFTTSGMYKVKYRPNDDWDFHLDTPSAPVNLTLALPHYRARHQPVDHGINMFIRSDAAPVKVKVCRPQPCMRFFLEIQAGTSDVTVWLPSDFKGRIHYSSKPSFSAGFTNCIRRNARLNESDVSEHSMEDEVVVATSGHITFRMWDVRIGAPENSRREKLKQLFGCIRRAPEVNTNWDFLLED